MLNSLCGLGFWAWKLNCKPWGKFDNFPKPNLNFLSVDFFYYYFLFLHYFRDKLGFNASSYLDEGLRELWYHSAVPLLPQRGWQFTLWICFIVLFCFGGRISRLALNSPCNQGCPQTSCLCIQSTGITICTDTLFYIALGTNPRASCLLGKHTANWAIFPRAYGWIWIPSLHIRHPGSQISCYLCISLNILSLITLSLSLSLCMHAHECLWCKGMRIIAVNWVYSYFCWPDSLAG